MVGLVDCDGGKLHDGKGPVGGVYAIYILSLIQNYRFQEDLSHKLLRKKRGQAPLPSLFGKLF